MSDSRITVSAPDGKIVTVPQSQIEEAYAQGYRDLDSAGTAELAQRKEYGQGIGNQLGAAAEGAARGLTFGGSDYALQALGVDKEGLAQRKARNPYSAMAGELGGIGLGVLATGGLGTVGAGVRGVSAAAHVAESVAARALAAGGIEGIGARMAAKGIGGAVEGYAYGGGQGVSEAALGEPEDVANVILAHATMGGLFGGVLGSATGVLGGVMRKGIDDFAAKRAASVERAALAPGKVTPVSGEYSVRAKAALEDLAGEQALDAAGLMKRDYKALQRSARSLEGEEGAAAKEELTLHDEAKRILREKNLVRAGDDMAATGDRIQGAIDQAKGGASRFIARLDEKAGGTFDLRGYADDLEKYASKFADSPEQAGEYRSILERAHGYRALASKNSGAESLSGAAATQRERLERKLQDLADNPGRNPAGAQERMGKLRAQLDAIPEAKAATSSGNVTLAEAERIKRTFDAAFMGTGAAKQIARESRGIFNGRLEAAVKKAATPEEFATWRADKRTMEALIPVRKANIDRQAAMQSNRKVSLTDYMTGGGLGVGLAHSAGGPVALAAGLAGSLIHKVVRERGNAVVSDFANRAAARLGGVDGARMLQLNELANAQSKVLRSVTKAATGFARALDAAPKVGAATSVKLAHEITFSPTEKRANKEEESSGKRHLAQLSQLLNDPETMRVRLAESLGDLQTAAPRISAEMHLQAYRATQYLYSRVPRNTYYAATDDLRDRWEPSPSQVRKFERTLRAVHDPVGTVRDMEHGHVTKEGIAALAAVYPAIHARLIAELLPKLAQAKNVPLQRRLELADIMGVSIDTLTSPILGATIAQAYSTLSKQPAPAARPAVSKNYAATQAATPLQRALESVG